MDTITLYRGIAVASQEVQRITTTIEDRGLSGNEGTSPFKIPDIDDVRARLEILKIKPDLTVADVFSSTPDAGIFACGTYAGAAHYALKNNFVEGKDDYPIAIEFTANSADIYVDSRDFLCLAFQLWDRDSRTHQRWQCDVLRGLFGPGIVRYFTAACGSKEQKYRIGMCNLATFDPEVTMDHLANTKVIAGRHNTRFSSAFVVKVPIQPKRITRVYSPAPAEEHTTAHIDLDDFLRGGSA